jgi:LysR family cyn operon transcriptional activator
MDLRKLEIFVCVADQNSFSKAAAALHMAQPAVSIAVRKLEESFNCRLFDRRGRRISLTAQGSDAYQRARAILNEVNEFSDHMIRTDNLITGELSIACPSMLATYYLPSLLNRFLANYPGLTATVTQAGTRHIKQMLIEDEIEIGVITGDRYDDSFSTVTLVEEEMVLCVAEDHPWSRRKSISVRQLDGAPMVLYEPDYYIREAFDLLCKQSGTQPEIRLQTNFLPLIVRTVRQQLGHTVGLNIMALEEAGIVGVPLRPQVIVRMGIASKTNRHVSRANRAFLDWLKVGS